MAESVFRKASAVAAAFSFLTIRLREPYEIVRFS